MAAMKDQDHDALIDRVTTGFGALLEQVQELAVKNDALHQRLSYVSTLPIHYLETHYLPYDENL